MDEFDRNTLGGTTGTGGTTGSTTGTNWDDVGTRSGSNPGSTGSTEFDATTTRSFGAEEHTGVKERVAGRVSEGIDQSRERLSQAVESGKNRLADSLQQIGDRIEERARGMDETGGIQRRAGSVVHRASAALDSSAGYLRDHDPADMRDDLERAIRERPLLSMGVAVGAGFLLARLLRD